jgi:hypothetical protein
LKSYPILVDTNLLILFIVGTASSEYINKHKRLTQFTVQDYDALFKIISAATAVLVTPNTLTETSNLIAYIAEPAKSHIFEVFRTVIANSEETYVPSRKASERDEFVRLGLTDASLVDTSTDEITVLTTDLDLYLAVMNKGASAINFNHVRDQYL